MRRIHLVEKLTYKNLIWVSIVLVMLIASPVYSQTESKFPAGSNAQNGDLFGGSVSISGDFAIVGAELPLQPDARKAYIYKRTGTGWIEHTKLLPPGDPCGSFLFGRSVAVDGTYAIVGAPCYSFGESKAFIYHFDGVNWTQEQALVPSNDFGKAFENGFGDSVSISGDFAIIGANERAYVFHRSTSGWIEQAMLTSGESPARQFGFSVAISGNYAIVGGSDGFAPMPDPAAAYIFFYDGTGWTKQAKLTPGLGITNGTRQSVSINGDYVIVGEVAANFSSSYEGKAYIFRRNGTIWERQPDLQSTPTPNTRFGWSVSIGTEYAVVGDPWDTQDSQGGAIYVFKHDGSALIKINSSDVTQKDFFGQSVSVQGHTILVGAPYKDVGTAGQDQGSTYSYGYLHLTLPDLRAIFDRYMFCKRCPPPPCFQCPPWNFGHEEWRIFPPYQRNFFIGLELTQIAPFITDEKLRGEIQRAGSSMMKKSTEGLKKLEQTTVPR